MLKLRPWGRQNVKANKHWSRELDSKRIMRETKSRSV